MKKDKLLDIFLTVVMLSSAAYLFNSFFPSFVPTLQTIVSSPDPDSQPDGNYIHNGSFTGSAWDVAAGDNAEDPTSITGLMGDKWIEASGWSNPTLHYAIDRGAGVRPGTPAQRCDILPGQGGEMQIMQSPLLPFGYYKVKVWLRASRHIPITLTFNANPPVVTKIMATDTWKPVELEGWVTSWTYTGFMIAASRPGSVWIDNASIYRTSDWMFIVPALILAVLIIVKIAAKPIKRILDDANRGPITVRFPDRSADELPTKVNS